MMSDTYFSLFNSEEDYDTHKRKMRIFETIQNIYGTEYLPKAKEVYCWVLTHEAEYQHVVLDLVERLAPHYLSSSSEDLKDFGIVLSGRDFDEEFQNLKAEIRDTFEWLHDRALK